MKKVFKKWSLLLLFIFPLIVFAEQINKEDEHKTILDVLSERTDAMNETLKKYNVTDIKDAFAIDNKDNNEREVPLRDPFNLSDKMGMQTPGNTGSQTSFLPSFDQNKIPKLKLKGVVSPNANSPEELLALLQINNKEVYMVRVGDELSYDPANPSAAMKIITISRLSVTVQVGSLGNVLIVR